jgi:hypothetical protein
MLNICSPNIFLDQKNSKNNFGDRNFLKCFCSAPMLRGVYFSFCGEDHPRKYFLFLAGYYFLGRIDFSAAGLVKFL